MNRLLKQYIKLANSGIATAQLEVGKEYFKRKSKESKDLACIYLKKAADNENYRAAFLLGLFYEKGINRNFDKSLEWYQKAAQGCVEAKYRLGVLLRSENPQGSHGWFWSAANQGHLESQFELANLLAEENQLDESYQAYLGAANKGHVDSMIMLGAMHLDGSFTNSKPNYSEAETWLLKAKDTGNKQVNGMLAALYVEKAILSQSRLVPQQKSNKPKQIYDILKSVDSYFLDSEHHDNLGDYYLNNAGNYYNKRSISGKYRHTVKNIQQIRDSYLNEPSYIDSDDYGLKDWKKKNFFDQSMEVIERFYGTICLFMLTTFLIPVIEYGKNKGTSAQDYDFLIQWYSSYINGALKLKTIFDEQIANDVQIASLFLGLIGVGLALIEIRSPSMADKIEHRLYAIFNIIPNALSKGKNTYYGIGCLSILFVIITFTFMQINAFLDINSGINLANNSTYSFVLFVLSFGTNSLWLGGVILLGVLLSLGSLFSFPKQFLMFLRLFAKGRELGMLGLLMAFVGLLGESYQVSTIIIHSHWFQSKWPSLSAI